MDAASSVTVMDGNEGLVFEFIGGERVFDVGGGAREWFVANSGVGRHFVMRG